MLDHIVGLDWCSVWHSSRLLFTQGLEEETMQNLLAPALFASVAILLSSGPSLALTTSTTSITCSSTKKLQATIDAVAAGTVATINVSGTCAENIVIPRGKTIILVGTGTTPTITAANTSLPAITSNGDTTLQKLNVTNTTGTGAANTTLVVAAKEGYLEIVSSDLLGTGVEAVAEAAAGVVSITNSRVVGGTYDAVDVWGGGSAFIAGDPSSPLGPTGKYETYIKSSNHIGISCAQGSVLNVRAKASGNLQGSVIIEQSSTGIATHLCQFTVWNPTYTKSNIQIRSNGTGIAAAKSDGSLSYISVLNNTGDAISLDKSTFDLSNVDVTGNGGIGLGALQSAVSLAAVTFNNTTEDIDAGAASSIEISNSAQSSFPKALTWTNSFNCSRGGRIDVDAGALVQQLGTQYSSKSCVYSY